MKATYSQFQRQVAKLQSSPGLPKEDQIMLTCLEEAIAAGSTGNYPAGSVITDLSLVPLAQGRNYSYEPHPNSRRHAEMEAIDGFESQSLPTHPSSSILFSSLEPCVMCTQRILLSGITQVKFLWKDPAGGGISMLPHFPTESASLAKRVKFSEYHGNSLLKQMGREIYELGEELWRIKNGLSS